MYCPKCATENLEVARFCRACGTDISLVPQAMTGRLPQTRNADNDDLFTYPDKKGRVRARKRHREKDKKPPSLEKAISSFFIGLSFLVISIALSRSPIGQFWWFWMLIPSAACLGSGVAEYLRLKQSQQAALPAISDERDARTGIYAPSSNMNPLPPHRTAELYPQPSSVTESTTRHLGTEAPTRHIAKPVESEEKSS